MFSAFNLHPAGQFPDDPFLAVHRHAVHQPGSQALVKHGDELRQALRTQWFQVILPAMLGILNPEEALKAAVFPPPPEPGFALCPEFRVDELLLLKASLLLPLFTPRFRIFFRPSSIRRMSITRPKDFALARIRAFEARTDRFISSIGKSAILWR